MKKFRSLFSQIPKSARTVRVEMNGEPRWKSYEDVTPKDTLSEDNQGRPIYIEKKVGRIPKSESYAEKKRGWLQDDVLFQLTQNDPESTKVLDYVMNGLAEEAATINFLKDELNKKGDGALSFSDRKVRALKAVGDTWVKRKEQVQSKEIDMESEVFQALFQFILETLRNSLVESGMRSEMVEVVFGKLNKKLSNTQWYVDAKNRMKKARKK